MITVHPAGNAGMMSGLLNAMTLGRVRLYSSDDTLVCTVYLAEPPGTINASGDLVLSPGIESAITSPKIPVRGEVHTDAGSHLFDCSVRLSSAPNANEELVIAAPNGFYVGALVQIQSGTFSTLP